jgi:hypothetical protein
MNNKSIIIHKSIVASCASDVYDVCITRLQIIAGEKFKDELYHKFLQFVASDFTNRLRGDNSFSVVNRNTARVSRLKLWQCSVSRAHEIEFIKIDWALCQDIFDQVNKLQKFKVC